MASNFRKSFNFRDGMQVATDDLVVSSNKVGVGTTAPARNLSVYGSSEFVGVATFTDAFHVGAAATFVGPVTLGPNVTVSAAGSVTAVNFYGDGATLSNLPTSQWQDTDVGLGFTSIYAVGNVGVGTTDPRHVFQVAGDPFAASGYTLGVSFDGFGNQYAAGIITANRFSGNLEASFLTGTISSERLPGQYALTGVITSIQGFDGNLVGIADSARTLVDFPNVGVTGLGATNINVTGVTTSVTIHVGTSGTGFAALSSGKIGVGTALPTSDIAVRKEFLGTLEVVSNKGQARVSVGQSVGVGQSTGMIRWGASDNTFDVVNNSWGNLNFVLHGGPAIPVGSPSGVTTGRWGFVYGQTNAERMTLTYDGYLGIGQTQPTFNVDVTGTGRFTSNVTIGGNLSVTGNVSAGSFTFPSVISGSNISITTGVSTFSTLKATQTVDFTPASFVGISTLGIGTATAQANTGLTVKNNAVINKVSIDDSLYCGGTGSGIGTFVGDLTAVNGFKSTAGAPRAIQIDFASSPNRIIFTVVGIGFTVLNLY